nr:thiosulfate sulfurtransferase 16, chloroplastic-like isoform X2 (THS16) [Polytomella parva]|eukprot:CAMPEP_0175061942 /NCGR_PEP_ID=MMETSP0052_2-20121109/13872_1 /TAXON_ID=51329 ORGANISM="Polytomella parva, Strain SAG 63-3" /NCGR_SAMPLE_ID=MMETSP0052_2 /ASSEMBLY_ACC=CAM_ASM_000194 /LENGTH=133 /DNA_ID=CAMNT_0016327867 /DNA_START=119 /DNA_END=520 /DNA_ORIENTATION=-
MASSEKSTLPKNVNVKEAFEILKANPSIKYLDVRTLEEVKASGTAPGAKVVPILEGPSMQPNLKFVNQVKSLIGDTSTPIIVGCKSGRRSQMAIQVMEEAGYTELANLNSGFDGWKAEGLPAEIAPIEAFSSL